MSRNKCKIADKEYTVL